MNKNYFLIIAVLMLLTVSCDADRNPLSGDNVDQIAKSIEKLLPKVNMINPADHNQLTDNEPETAGIQGQIEIDFTEYMNDTTVNSKNISIQMIDGPMLSDIEVTYLTYRKKAIVSYDFFASRSAYLIRLSTNITDMNGNPLDGNGNDKNDGEFDDFISQFYTSGGQRNLNDYDPPQISGHSPTGNNVGTMPVIRVNFTSSDLDTSTLSNLNISLFKSQTNARVDIRRSSVSSNEVRFNPVTMLDLGTKYKIIVDALSVKDVNGNSLDTDDDGVSLPAEKDFEWEFIVMDGPDTDGTPPQVTRITDFLTYADVTFNEQMDTTTFTSDNVRFFDNNGNIPGIMEPNVDGTKIVYYFDRDRVGLFKYFISMDVTDKSGNKLDGDKDGIGGEAGEDDFTNIN